MSGIFWRVIASIIAFGLYGLGEFIISVPATLVTGEMAGRQFDNSDLAYGASLVGMNAFKGIGFVTSLIFLLVLVAIWWGPLKRAWGAIGAGLCILVMCRMP